MALPASSLGCQGARGSGNGAIHPIRAVAWCRFHDHLALLLLFIFIVLLIRARIATAAAFVATFPGSGHVPAGPWLLRLLPPVPVLRALGKAQCPQEAGQIVGAAHGGQDLRDAANGEEVRAKGIGCCRIVEEGG